MNLPSSLVSLIPLPHILYLLEGELGWKKWLKECNERKKERIPAISPRTNKRMWGRKGKGKGMERREWKNGGRMEEWRNESSDETFPPPFSPPCLGAGGRIGGGMEGGNEMSGSDSGGNEGNGSWERREREAIDERMNEMNGGKNIATKERDEWAKQWGKEQGEWGNEGIFIWAVPLGPNEAEIKREGKERGGKYGGLFGPKANKPQILSTYIVAGPLFLSYLLPHYLADRQ